jgi:hypothetical protein
MGISVGVVIAAIAVIVCVVLFGSSSGRRSMEYVWRVVRLSGGGRHEWYVI